MVVLIRTVFEAASLSSDYLCSWRNLCLLAIIFCPRQSVSQMIDLLVSLLHLALQLCHFPLQDLILRVFLSVLLALQRCHLLLQHLIVRV